MFFINCALSEWIRGYGLREFGDLLTVFRYLIEYKEHFHRLALWLYESRFDVAISVVVGFRREFRISSLWRR